MDKDGYPEEHELEKIRNWPHNDFEGLMDYVQELWWNAEWGFRQKGKKYYLSTGGWSGNEDIISAMNENLMFWSMCWQESKRGGHYIFEVKALKEK